MGDNHLKKELPQDLPIQSQALAANIAQCPTHDSIDPKYMVLLEVISGYAGLMEASHAFLCELTHPLKNWGFILEGARNYGLKHMSLLRKSPEGPGAASLLIDILRDAAVEARDENLRHEAVDNLIVFVQKLAGEIQGPQDGFSAVVGHGIDLLSQLPQEPFLHAVFSYYSLTKAVKTYWEKASPDSAAETCARLLTRYFVEVYDYWRSRRDPRDWFEKETGARIHDDEVARLFELISVAEAERLRAGLDGLSAEPARERLEKLLDLPLSAPGYPRTVRSPTSWLRCRKRTPGRSIGSCSFSSTSWTFRGYPEFMKKPCGKSTGWPHGSSPIANLPL